MQPARIRTRSDRPVPWLLPARVGPDGAEEPGPGRPLPKAVRVALKPFFPAVQFGKVRVHQGIPNKLRENAGIRHPIAMTVRRDIYVAPGYADWKTPSGLRTLVHEVKHVDQWERKGDAVYPEYRRQTLYRGYWGNPLEREAYKTENAVVRQLVAA